MKHRLFTTDIFDCGYTLADFVQYCEDNEFEIPTEENDRYYSWLSEMLDWDWDDFLNNIKYGQYNTACYITGSVGCWNGRYEIMRVDCDDLVSAIKKCINGQDDFEIFADVNAVYVNSYNHDSQYHGGNEFKIVVRGKKIKGGYLY